MQRPDINSQLSTNTLSAVHFSPRWLLYQRLLGWILRLLIVQLVLSLVLWLALRATLYSNGPTAAAPSTWFHQGIGATVKALNAELMTTDALSDLRLFAFAQAGALLLLHLIFIPTMRRRLTEHVQGIREVLEAIKELAEGSAPKPLAAGRKGEIGYLSVAFNDMACRLLASRKALLDANHSLEQRVEERTTELRQAAAKLDKMASTDALTGLFNRRYFTEQSRMLFSESIRRDSDLVCIMIDLDNFKTVNDTLGHQKGDELLCVAAEVMRSACRGDDVIARLGGDEFIILMPMADPTAMLNVAQRLQDHFVARAGELLAGMNLPKTPSMSIGISSRKLCKAESFDAIVTSGDAALYEAKGAGKRSVRIFNQAKQAA
jgi:diguanylate cyclase (GGDEF)-like protein